MQMCDDITDKRHDTQHARAAEGKTTSANHLYNWIIGDIPHLAWDSLKKTTKNLGEKMEFKFGYIELEMLV